jgi:Flp pilus assembly secretin CpaC
MFVRSVIASATRSRALAAVFSALSLCAAVAAQPVQANEPISVVVDQAKVLRISAPANTVIIGNPAIADATVFDTNTLVITGRSYGTTNLIVLDAKGEAIADKILVVSPSQKTTVQIHRRSARFSYSCNPNCAPAMAPGDFKDYYDRVKGQIASRHEMSKTTASGDN